MRQPLSEMRFQLRGVISSIRHLIAGRWRYKVGFGLLSICLVAAAKFDSVSEARGAIRQHVTRARTAFVMMDPDTLVVLGPKQFVTVANNSQLNFVESFSVPPQTAPPDSTSVPAPTQYTIRLQRVGGSLSIATVAINGTQVATVADFSSATYIERQITVNQGNGNTNSLTITLKGAAAAGLTATIVGVPDGTFAILGPTVYSKGTTTPSHYTDTFTLPSGASAPYAVSARASVAGTKATIAVNGVQVIKDADFGTNITYVIRPSTLSASNTLSVDVRGTTGTTITVTVLATDKTPPTLTIATPAPNLVTNASSVTVSGTSQDQSATQVKVNSVIATMSGTQYSAAVPLVLGANSLAIRATDRAGNHVDSSRTVTRDTLPPTLTLTSPADSSYTSSNNVTVAGTFSDAGPVTIKANGVLIGQSTPFSGTYSGITPGVNFVTITATDAAGNVTTQVRRVTQVTEPPVLAVNAPTMSQLGDGTTGFYTNMTLIQVSGTATGTAPMTVTVNGVSTPINNGTFSASVPLTEGWNTLTVTATGPSGLVRTQVVSGKLNTSPPSFVINAPYAEFQSYPYLNTPTTVFRIYPFSYPFTPFPYVSATLNGVSLTVDSTGNFSGPLLLAEGWNTLTATVTDNAGRVGVRADSVLLDTHPPTVEVTSPANGAHVSTNLVFLHVTYSTGFEYVKTEVYVTVNGHAAEAAWDLEAPPGTVSGQILLDSGTNVISVVVWEPSGNNTTVTRTVTFGTEQVPPDPATVAPPLDPTIATTTYAATSFLYTGTNPIQTGVIAGTIQPLQAAVIRGSVRMRTGEALPAVKITVLDHPEFGQTLSRADGAFDLVVNGGNAVTLSYEKTGFLPAQRQVSPFWQDYTVVDSVTLVALDPQVTTVDFSQPAQAAQGSAVTDEFGTRQATMIFKGGTHASLKMPDGTTQPLSSIAVRATEYTVGPTGESAMPAPLPPTSSYTYAVELSADEAIAAGATSVVFDQPVSIYVDNFLNFPVGKPVPVGIYDRVKSQWVASPDGRIVKVLQIANGRASLDVDGSGNEATPEALATLGVDDAELTKLGALYTPGKSIWRVQLSHFTIVDFNDPPFRDSTAKPPHEPDPVKSKVNHTDCTTPGSVIGCERQTLGESIPIAGTSLRLNYQSDGTPGYRDAYSANISLIGDTIPQDLQRIRAEVRVAGRLMTQTFGPQPNQTAHFVWDGNDVYGRPIQGAQLARIRIGYVYPQKYANVLYLLAGGAFGAYGSSAVTPDRARSEATLWQDMTMMLGTHDTRAEGLGGWTINAHHYYDPMGRVLHLGDGTQRAATASANATTTIAGTDCTTNCANSAKPGDRALDAVIGTQGLAVASDGTMYIADGNANRIWRVNAAGILELVAGNGTTQPNGDSIPATSAGIRPLGFVRLGPDNSIYFEDGALGQRIRRIDKNGIVTTVAGTGVCGTSVADGTLATQADLCFFDFAIAPDGALYLTFQTDVYRVGADGILTRVVGDGTSARCPSGSWSWTCAEGKPANSHAVFHRLGGIAVAPDGTLYVANREFRVAVATVIYRIGTDGIVHRFAGGESTETGSRPFVDGEAAIMSPIVSRHSALAVGPEGGLYFTISDDGYVARVDEKGIGRIIAGCIWPPGAATCISNSGGRATLTTLSQPRDLDFGPDGRLYILDRIARRVDAPLPALGIVSTAASEDGSELYVFDPDGRHLRTIDALLGTTIFDFVYDAAGHLSSISDGQGNATTIERDGAGLPVAFVAPFGQRTAVTTDGQRYLSSIQSPGQTSTVIVHRADGLLSSLTDLNGIQHQFTYDDNGLLTRDDDGSGGFTTLARTRTDSSSSVMLTTAMGATAVHSTTARSIGGSRRVSVDGAGLATSAVEEPNGTVTSTTPNGMIITVAQGSDPRFGLQVPNANRLTTRTAGGLVATVTTGRRAVLSNAADPMSLVTQVDSQVVNGRVFRNSYVTATRSFTAITPMGRSTTARLDGLGRVIEEATLGITPVQYQYDQRGLPTQMTQGSREWLYTYDLQGRLASATDPLTRNSQYFYDAGGRLTRQVLPDAREMLYAYDVIGNLRSVAPLGRPAHQFQYNSLNLVTSYDPPSLGAGTWSTTYAYNLDRKLTQVARPDGQTLSIGYDAAGRPSTVTIPSGAVQYNFDPGTGGLTSVSGPYNESLSFIHDGSLLTRLTWAGEVAGAVSASYNGDFRVTGLGVNSDPATTFEYDSDGLLRQAGDMTITRSDANRLITGTALGALTTSQSYTTLGELAHQTASVSSTALFDVTYTRDALGRITELTETIGGTATTKGYIYDLAGRLSEVRENGALTAVYEYDPNGNRLRLTRPSGTETGTYDDQDRMLTYGSASYAYARNGELSMKTVGSEITQYEYDVLGNLRRVILPDATVIGYVVDGLNRRVGKKLNGVLVQGFLYQSQLNPIAELDGAGNVVSRFVYGSAANVPDYMTKSGNTYRLVSDQVGSIRLVVDIATGAVVQRLDYDEWGNVTQNTNPGFQPFGFAGGLYEQRTELIRLGARDYASYTGAWTTKDPVRFGQADASLYVYARGDPVNLIDPSGLEPKSLSDCMKQFLNGFKEDVYPDVDFDKVSINEGGWVPTGFDGITTGAGAGYEINFVEGQYQPGTVDGVALLMHELLHTQQYRQFGLGPFGFWFRYAGEAIKRKASGKSPWKDNRYEVDANALQDYMRRYIKSAYGPQGPCPGECP